MIVALFTPAVAFTFVGFAELPRGVTLTWSADVNADHCPFTYACTRNGYVTPPVSPVAVYLVDVQVSVSIVYLPFI